ncbi:amidophosphoribosyltransferase [Desulfuribacillus stibiiarsenatis]|uniref:Amidophosphoribosyltransferase n=1 Tax=Desulfuribacillus stibiiarsenatis TaxID=1390249 RepID=A0A1E5L558_9FIRM|nr:amidophosphoribosyltransferase [Desulfuribacillus stibiiarsenatis]OEH85198.1 amidophosphoribosyltransferase [Desulfuribacillus stibiiarsenatis]
MCGVFGIYNNSKAAQLTYYALYALQHRGQESAGIISSNEGKFHHHKGLGLVADVFKEEQIASLEGKAAIGHVRYSTTGANSLQNAQPLFFKYQGGNLALAHNGNLVNAHQLRSHLERQGSIFQTTSDTEVAAHLIARAGYENSEQSVKESLGMIKGSYAMLFLADNKLIAVRDPNGIRPLSLGKLNGSFVVSSETCAFDTIGATFLRDVEPGEMIIIDQDGIRSERVSSYPTQATCVFEYIYFARPDSDIEGLNVHTVRKQLGKRLAQEAPIEADVVTGVPDSSISAAIGYAEEANIPYELGLIKNRYIGRTFIQPSQELRERGVRLKLNAVRKVVAGKRVVMIDDSIVRGTTSGRIVSMLREAGATEVHVRISSPPVTHPCYYGIDTSAKEELIASSKSIEEIREHIGADTLAYLSTEGMLDTFKDRLGAISEATQCCGYCEGCFSGSYPTEIIEQDKHSLER